MMADSGWKRLKEIHDGLKRGEDFSDEDLIQGVIDLQVQTNAEYAAYLLFSAIAPICGHRPQLTEALLHLPILPLIYYGIERTENIIAWLEIKLDKPMPFDGIDTLGLDWIRWLITQPQIIQKSLEDELEKISQEELGE